MKKRILLMMSCLFVAAPAVFGDVTELGEHRGASYAGVPTDCALRDARVVPDSVAARPATQRPNTVHGATAADN